MARKYPVAPYVNFALIFALCIAVSCGDLSKPAHDLSDADLNSLAELHCTAIGLRSGRFALADTLRNLEKPGNMDSLLWYAAIERKEKLALESRTLADSIESKMSDIMKWPPDKKQIFLERLQNELRRMGCTEN